MNSLDPIPAFSQAIELLYNTLDDPAAWPRWTSHVAAYLGADGGKLTVVDLDHPQSSWAVEHRASPVAGATTVSCILRRNESSVATAQFHRQPLTPAFGEVHARFLEALRPHAEWVLSQAEHRLFLEDALALSQRRSAAVYLLDSAGYVVYVNDAASRLAGSGDLKIEGRALRVPCQDSQHRLDVAIGRCLDDQAVLTHGVEQFLRLERHSNGLPLVAAISPNRRRASPPYYARERVKVVLAVVDGARSQPLQDQLLSSVLGLTPQEERLTASLATGCSLKQAAGELGITYETARTYLKTVQRKTGLSSQATLVSFLARLAECRVGPRDSRCS